MTTVTRQLVRDMIEQQFTDPDEYEVPVIVDEITNKIRLDVELYTAYVDECLRTMVHHEALQVVHAQRIRSRKAAEAAQAAKDAQSPATFRPLAQRLSENRSVGLRWLSHAEHIGKGHIKIMAMTRSQLALAISYRMRQRNGHDLRIQFLREVDRGIAAAQNGTPGDEKVGDIYTAEQLEEIFDRVRSDRNNPPSAAAGVPV